ncbi:MAG: lysophospholipid acyltransferase family protein [Deltaproteobacteria bacterium]|nr:lysophospholipid acyltransferase family protein [Deltaproteobacteria bacterium]
MGRDQRYSAFTKEKSQKLKKIRHLTEFVVLTGLKKLAGIGTVGWVRNYGTVLGRLAFLAAKKDKGIADFQLQFCLPELSKRERTLLIKGMFENFGKTLIEGLIVDKIRKNKGYWICLHHEEIIKKAVERGKGGIFVVGHFGNWELFTLVFEILGIKGYAVESPIGVTELDDMLMDCRKSENLTMIPRGDVNSSRAILKCFKDKQFLILAIDQDTKAQNIFVDFFGRKAATTKGAASLAQRFDIPVISAFGARNDQGKHDFSFELLSDGPYEKTEQETFELTQRYTLAVERHIRKYPSQWVWFHRRWKTQPDEKGQSEI